MSEAVMKQKAGAQMNAQETESKAQGKKKISTKELVIIALFGSISMVLMLLEFSVPFALPFLKMDLSDLPAILATFIMGPAQGVAVAAIKVILNLLTNGTATAGIGELANFLGAVFYILPAALIYKHKKGKAGAALALIVATIVVGFACVLMNTYLTFPAYGKAYGMSMEVFVGMGTKINPSITNVFTLMMFSVLPFNLMKYGIASVVTFFTYKKMKHAIGMLFHEDK